VNIVINLRHGFLLHVTALKFGSLLFKTQLYLIPVTFFLLVERSYIYMLSHILFYVKPWWEASTMGLLLLPTTSATSSKTSAATSKTTDMSSVSESTAYLPVSEDNSSIEEKPTKTAVSSTRMKAVKKKVTCKETKKPSVAKHFVYAVTTPKKIVQSPPPKVASANDSNKTKKKPLKLKKVVSNISTKKRIVELAFPLPTAASTVAPKELKKKPSKVKKGLSMVASSKEKPSKQKNVVAPRERVAQASLAPAKKGQAPAKKGHVTKKRAVQALSPPVQKCQNNSNRQSQI
jgi:hypothetical protein